MKCKTCKKNMSAKECNYTFGEYECKSCKDLKPNKQQQVDFLKTNSIDDIPF